MEGKYLQIFNYIVKSYKNKTILYRVSKFEATDIWYNLP